ncbi:hypothetical protein [Phyllobacterium ifriqiyense]|uniref:hypothetical protein n=1 Tax=Phyllobacterium ifriqiyense TaxID=314238 RepID=UPI003392D0B0
MELAGIKFGLNALRNVPDAERHAFHQLDSQFHSMNRLVVEFDATVAVFDYASLHWNHPRREENEPASDFSRRQLEMRQISRWPGILAHNAVMIVYHYHRAIVSIAACMHRSPTISMHFAYSELIKIRKSLNSDFPKFEDIRNQVAHYIERAGELNTLEKHAVGRVFIGNGLIGRTFANTIDGKLHTIDISAASTEKLNNTASLIFSLYDQAVGQIMDEKQRQYWIKNFENGSVPNL